MRRAVCESSREMARPSEQLELEAHCLDSQLEALRTLAQQIDEGHTELVDQVLPLVERWADQGPCADGDRLGRRAGSDP